MFCLCGLQQSGCLKALYQRLADNVFTLEQILQAEEGIILTVNSSVMGTMTQLREAYYNILCDIDNTLIRKDVSQPELDLTIATTPNRPVIRFRRDYLAFLCMRSSLLQAINEVNRLDRSGFYA